MTSIFLKRAAVAVVGSSIVVSGLVLGGPAPAAHAEAAPGPAASRAASWLDRELRTLTAQDAGEAIDYGLALEATGASPARLAALTADIDGVLAEFLPADPPASQYDAINVAMAADYYATVGATPPAATDLFDRFTGMVDEDSGQFGPVAWSYSQTYAVNALRHLGEQAKLEKARALLLEQQCDGGFWGFDETCTADLDGTALAVLALLPDDADPAVATAIDDAVAWLKTQQEADGGFGEWGTNTSGTTSSGPSSGLASWALRGAGETTAATRAARWLLDHQVDPVRGCDTPLDGQEGAVAFDDDYLGAASQGIPDIDRGTWLLTTAQSYAALTHVSAGSASLRVPTFLDGGGTGTIRVAGLDANERGCLSVGRKEIRFRADDTGRAVVRAAVSNRTGFIGVSADTARRSVGSETVALAAKKVPFDLKARVARQGKQRVAVRGLWSGEKVVVRHDGKVVARGKATTTGRFVATFGVGRKPGRHKVTVVGQFADRTATKTFRVR